MALGAAHDHVVSMRELIDAEIPRWFTRHEVRVGRWRRRGRYAVVLHNGPLDQRSRWRAALLSVGPPAVLQAAGLTGLTDTAITVSVPRGSRPRRTAGVTLHETRRFVASDVLDDRVRRMRPATAAVHAALWASSDRQATLFVTMTVQQRLATVAQLRDVLDRVRRHPRRRLLTRLLVDLDAGVHSLGELDVASAMRRRGLPEPVRQSIRRRPSGTEYLDAEFPEHDLALEVDGRGHDDPEQRLADLLRDLRQLAEGSPVIRIPLVAWRLDEEAVLDHLEDVFAARGWVRAA